jgi:hypothetical protein
MRISAGKSEKLAGKSSILAGKVVNFAGKIGYDDIYLKGEEFKL